MQIEEVLRHSLNAFKANWQQARFRRNTRKQVFLAWRQIQERNKEVRCVGNENVRGAGATRCAQAGAGAGRGGCGGRGWGRQGGCAKGGAGAGREHVEGRGRDVRRERRGCAKGGK